MAIINKRKTGDVEEIWFQSSNIHYTKVDFSKAKKIVRTEADGITFEVPTINVIMVFNRGAQYLYKDVELNDYTSFVEILNRDDNTSHGKAFNKFVKPYPFEKLDNVDIITLK